jgi:hypothetical protein
VQQLFHSHNAPVAHHIFDIELHYANLTADLKWMLRMIYGCGTV